MKKYKVAILGAKGAVGREMMKILAERDFPVEELHLLASERSVGQKIDWQGRELTVELACDEAALKRLGDEAPAFLAAVTDLTASACEARNAATPDAPGVFYQSVMSYCRKAQHGKFPLNMTYPIVKHFDGLNDGLVAVDSAKWGDQFTLLEPRGHRGISHGDVVDLNRENIPGFDVREFYVSLVADLKNRGF